MIKTIIIESTKEHLRVADTNTTSIENNELLQIAVGGELAVIYLTQVVLNEGAPKNQELEVGKLCGHFKAITDLKFIKWVEEVRPDHEHLLMSASKDFSVRIWHTLLLEPTQGKVPPPFGIQILMYLDINKPNQEVLCCDWQTQNSNRHILSVDTVQSLRVWPVFREHSFENTHVRKICAEIK